MDVISKLMMALGLSNCSSFAGVITSQNKLRSDLAVYLLPLTERKKEKEETRPPKIRNEN